MFLGTYTPRLDEKGRLFLPVKFRERLQGGVIITKGQERCLYVYPVAEFEKFYGDVAQAATSFKNVRDYQRMILSAASDEVPDRQGRISIPAVLRDYASLQHECTVIGAGSRVEIWDSPSWDAYLAQAEPQYADLSGEVVPGQV